MRKVFNIKVNSIALCKTAKNKQKIFLMKSSKMGEGIMTKEKAIKLLESENITEEQRKEILDFLPEDIKNEVEIYFQAKKDIEEKNKVSKDKEFDKDGFDKNGFNKEGFDKKGFDKDGFNKDGYNEAGLNKDGFNKEGFNKDGFDKSGFNKDGKDKDGNDKDSLKDVSDEEFNSMLDDAMKKEGFTKEAIESDEEAEIVES